MLSRQTSVYAARSKTKSGQGVIETPKWRCYNALKFVGRIEDRLVQSTVSNLDIAVGENNCKYLFICLWTLFLINIFSYYSVGYYTTSIEAKTEKPNSNNAFCSHWNCGNNAGSCQRNETSPWSCFRSQRKLWELYCKRA